MLVNIVREIRESSEQGKTENLEANSELGNSPSMSVTSVDSVSESTGSG